MSVKLADTLSPLGQFPIGEAKDISIDINGTEKTLQNAYEDGDFGGGDTIQVTTMPLASIDNLGQIVEYIGASGTYTNGYFYQCVSDGETLATYSWTQKNVQPSNATANDVSYDNTTSELEADNVQEAIDEVVAGLGTASGKDYTDTVRPNSHDLVESGSVYSAINNALSTIYTPRGDLACSQLTSALLIEANVGNVYTMSDSGLTSALFINGAGITINANDNVGIIKAGADTILFNYMGNAFDLHDYQKKELTTPILGEDTVEGALGVIAEKDKRIWIGHKADWDLLTTAEKIVYDEAHFDDDEGTDAQADVYSTTETKTNKVWIDGKPIYRKVVDLGTLPNATTKTVSHGISNLDVIIKWTGYVERPSNHGHFPLPYVFGGVTENNIGVFANQNLITITTGADRSMMNGTIILEYTKTTD